VGVHMSTWSSHEWAATRHETFEASAPSQAYHPSKRDIDSQCASHITLQESVIRVALSDSGLQDEDLSVVVRSLESLLQRGGFAGGAEYSIILDLSCNPGITDWGVQVYVAPFLARWPCCRQLRLCQTCIGDDSLRALGPWAASGYAYELYLSSLGGHVTPDEVLQFFRNICRSGQYPYWSVGGYQAALWIQMAHNGIRHIDDLLARGHSEGIALRVLEEADLWTVRPGSLARQGGHRTSAIHLPMFRMQSSMVSLPPDSGYAEGQGLLTLLKQGSSAQQSPLLSTAPTRTSANNPEFKPMPRPSPLVLSAPPGKFANEREPKPMLEEEKVKDMALANDDVALATTLLVSLLESPVKAETGSTVLCPENSQAAQDMAIEGTRCHFCSAASAALDLVCPHCSAHVCLRCARTHVDSSALCPACETTSFCSPQTLRLVLDATKERSSSTHRHPASRQSTPRESLVMSEENAKDSHETEIVVKPVQSEGLPVATERRVQPQLEDGPVSTEVWEDISWLLQEVTLFKKSDFDGRVRQYLHAIRTASGRSGVQEALLKVRNSVNGMHRDDVKKPSAYLQTLLRRHLKSSC